MSDKIPFHIAIQTHDLSNNQDPISHFKRYGCEDKTEIVKRCTRSLINSINYASSKIPEINFTLQVFDDHSTDTCIKNIKDNLNRANFKTSFTGIEGKGLVASLKECYLYLKQEGEHFVYQVQDDYLFHERAIYEMLRCWLKFQPRFQKPLSLMPFDDPYRYWDENIVPVRIVQGPDRHWRQTYQTPCTFMTLHSVLKNEWDCFEPMFSLSPLDPKFEEKSVIKLWQQREYIVLSPIPTLALHFQTDCEKDPYIDWQSWWDKYKD